MRDQIKFETNGLTVLAVPLRSEDKPHSLEAGRLYYSFISNENGSEILDFIDVPNSELTFLCCTSDMNEQHAEKLVKRQMSKLEGIWPVFHYYGYETAIEAIPELLRSHGIDPVEKWVLLIKE